MIAFASGPVFSVVAFAFFPLFMTTLGFFGKLLKKATNSKLEQLKKLGALTEETFSALKLVISFA